MLERVDLLLLSCMLYLFINLYPFPVNFILFVFKLGLNSFDVVIDLYLLLLFLDVHVFF